MPTDDDSGDANHDDLPSDLDDVIEKKVEQKLNEKKNQVQKRSRRSFLASLAAAAGVGAMGVSWIQDAQATDGSAVGQIGTPSEKVNIYAHAIGDSNNPVDELYVDQQTTFNETESFTDVSVTNQADIASASIEQADVGKSAGQSGIAANPSLISNGDVTVTVGSSGDYSTIQNAIESEWRPILRHNVTIEIDETAGDFGEDVFIPGFISVDRKDNTDGSSAQMLLTRQGGSGQWETSSVMVASSHGNGSVEIRSAKLNDANPWENENAAIAAHGTGNVKVFNCSVGTSNPDGFIVSKGMTVQVGGTCDLGADNVSTGFRTKNMGLILVKNSATLNGSVTGDLYVNGEGVIQHSGVFTTASGALVNDAQGSGLTRSNGLHAINPSNNTEYRPWFTALNGDVEIRDADNQSRIELWSGDMGFVRTSSDDGAMVWEEDQGTRIGLQDLTTNGPPKTNEAGVLYRHDGSSSKAAGLYEPDPGNSQYIGIGAASGTTIPY